MSTWIRFTQAGYDRPRTDVDTLELTDEEAAGLAERIAAVTTSTSGQMTEFEQWPEGAKHSVLYVRAEPAAALARQNRDQLIGAELIRRFDLTPHIVIHLATERGPAYVEDGRLYPFDWNDAGTAKCGLRPVNTHMADDPEQVTCKDCRQPVPASSPDVQVGGAL